MCPYVICEAQIKEILVFERCNGRQSGHFESFHTVDIAPHFDIVHCWWVMEPCTALYRYLLEYSTSACYRTWPNATYLIRNRSPLIFITSYIHTIALTSPLYKIVTVKTLFNSTINTPHLERRCLKTRTIFHRYKKMGLFSFCILYRCVKRIHKKLMMWEFEQYLSQLRNASLLDDVLEPRFWRLPLEIQWAATLSHINCHLFFI